MSPATGKTFLASSSPLIGARAIVSPFQFTTQGTESLTIASACSLAGQTIVMQARLLDVNGNISEARWTHTPNADRSLKYESFPLQAGAVMSIVVFTATAGAQDGQVFVNVFLTQGQPPGALLIVGQLIGGYITANRPIGWPGTPIQQATDGPGALLTTVDVAPAVGSQYIALVPFGARWELLRFAFALTTSAAVGNRVIRVRIRDHGVDILGITLFPTVATASNGWFCTAAGNLPMAAEGGSATQTAPLPSPVLLRNTQEFGTSIFGLQGGDSITVPAYTVREWLDIT